MTVPGSRLLNASDRVVVLGDPGGGKSTLAARTVRDLANDPAGPVPLLLVLRDFVEEFRVGRSTIAEHLASLCRSPYQVEPPVDALEYLLLNRRAVVIFDGLDELFEPAVRTKVAEAIHGFAHRYPNTPVLVTSRKVGYYESPLSEALFQVAELEAFSEAQVAEYARKWFALDRASLADKFMGESELVADLRTNPLMLSLMCGLYRDEGYIPSNRPDVYEKCALLLFERWDKQRGLNVSQRFDAHVRQAIQSLAWWLYTDREHQTSLTRARLQEFMTEFLHRERFADRADAEDAAASFIDFCTGRAWVLSKTGLRGNQELFDFTHRTFLEYFAATHMVRRDPHAARLFEQLQPHLRRAGWEVVGQLALQTLNRSVENGANDFLDALITAAGESDLPERSNLLAFAGRSLAFVVPNPAVVRRVVAEIVTFFLEMPDIDGKPGARYVPGFGRLFIYDQAFMALQAVTGELMGDIKNAVVESIASALCREPVPDNVLLACEDPRFFLIDTVDDPNRQGSFAELSASYQARLQDHPFAWHDVRRVLDGNLPVKKLVKRHGVQALYPDVYMSVTAAEGRAHFGIASQLRMRTITNADTFAAEIVPVLTSCAKPWVQDNAIFDNHDFARGHDELGLVNRGSYFAAVLLLTLPLVEYKIINAGEVRLPASDPVLGDIPVLCEGARLGRIPALSLKAALAPKAMPAAAADFVARWANHEFSLLDPALTPR